MYTHVLYIVYIHCALDVSIDNKSSDNYYYLRYKR